MNKSHVLNIKGRKFKRKGGHNLAAIRIQCAWRRYRDRSSYLEYRKRKWAAGVNRSFFHRINSSISGFF